RFQRDRCPTERPPVTVATGGIAQWHTDEMAPRFQAVFGTAAHFLGSSIAHCGFEEGANDKALAKGRRVPCEACRQDQRDRSRSAPQARIDSRRPTLSARSRTRARVREMYEEWGKV